MRTHNLLFIFVLVLFVNFSSQSLSFGQTNDDPGAAIPELSDPNLGLDLPTEGTESLPADGTQRLESLRNQLENNAEILFDGEGENDNRPPRFCRIERYVDIKHFGRQDDTAVRTPQAINWHGANDDYYWKHYFSGSDCRLATKVKLMIVAYDVDSGTNPGDEHDKVFIDGHYVGDLKGSNNNMSVTEFDINPDWLNDNGRINVFVNVDANNGGWLVAIYGAALVVDWEWKPPIAEFVAMPTTGVGPLEVHFKNLSKCAYKYYWDFGDGSFSTEKNPCHTFGDYQKYYTVTLTAVGCGGKDTETKEKIIAVLRPVDVNFEAAPIAGAPGLEVKFENHTGGNAGNFLFDYGDGSSDYLVSDITKKEHPSHTYEKAGEYTVSLKAWGSGGSDELTLPGLVYVDSLYKFLVLNLVSEGATYPGEGWENAIDHDIYGNNSAASGVYGDAWATFMLADSGMQLNKVRLLTESVKSFQYKANLAQDFEVWTSEDGENFEITLSATSVAENGTWEVFMLDTPKAARYVKVKLTSSRGEHAKYLTIAELQLFGSPVPAVFGKNSAYSLQAKPTDFALDQNYPNPFNPETVISYHLPVAAKVTLNIYNIQGQLIRSLVNQNLNSGSYQAIWNGMNDRGEKVGSGIYIYRIESVNENNEIFSFTRKMSLMK